ncbi:MAG TPA: hypothetical protein VIX82_04980, partial [Solirubrobacteraceae bacterium]
LGLAVTGPVAAVIGVQATLISGGVFCVIGVAATVAVPEIRSLQRSRAEAVNDDDSAVDADNELTPVFRD